MNAYQHIEFTEKQKENLDQVTSVWFSKKQTEDYFHFSLNGTRMNYDTNSMEAVYEIYTDDGGFFLTIALNDKKKGLVKTISLKAI